jgi:hypothetical protein
MQKLETTAALHLGLALGHILCVVMQEIRESNTFQDKAQPQWVPASPSHLKVVYGVVV